MSIVCTVAAGARTVDSAGSDCPDDAAACQRTACANRVPSKPAGKRNPLLESTIASCRFTTGRQSVLKMLLFMAAGLQLVRRLGYNISPAV
jgi:hypothetical protein